MSFDCSKLTVFAGLSLFFAAPVSAQENPPAVPENPDPTEIEVTGERPLSESDVSRNVYELAQSNSIGSPIPRFHDPLCLNVLGLGAAIGEEVAQRIRDNARAASMAVSGPDCDVNAMVIIVDDPEQLIARMRDTHQDFFNRRALREIGAAIYRNDPVIAWNVNQVRNRFGQKPNVVGGSAALGGELPLNGAGEPVPVNDECIPSRLLICFSYARQSSIVVFDIDRLEGVHLDQLADYATMFLIGSPRRLLDFDDLIGASILTLFDVGPLSAPMGLTPMDRAYLLGLYSLKPNEDSMRLVGSTRRAYRQITGTECGSDSDACALEAE